MSHYFTLGTPVIVACLGLVGIWLKHRLDRQDRQVAEVASAAAEAAVAAALAATRSLPTSNGFAEYVKGSLARIEVAQAATDARVDTVTTVVMNHLENRRG